MDAMYSFIEIKYNDDDTKRLTDLNEGFSYTDNASGEADSISLSLNNQSSQFLKKFYPDDNDYIKAWINARNWKADNKNSRLFCGKFLIDAITLSGFPQKAEIKGISVPIKTNFNVTQKNKTWKNKMKGMYKIKHVEQRSCAVNQISGTPKRAPEVEENIIGN